MPTLSTIFTTILTGLRAAVANSSALRSANPAHAERDRARTALLVLVWGRIGRTVARFEALFARWRAGTLPKPRRSRAGQPTTPREKSRLPAGRAWLVHVVGYEAAGRASQLQHLLARPDMAEFLQAAPQAGRILRPLCHMLGIDPPLEARRAQPPPPTPATPKPPTRAPAHQPCGPAAAPPAGAPPAGARPARRPSRHTSPAPPLRFSPA